MVLRIHGVVPAHGAGSAGGPRGRPAWSAGCGPVTSRRRYGSGSVDDRRGGAGPTGSRSPSGPADPACARPVPSRPVPAREVVGPEVDLLVDPLVGALVDPLIGRWVCGVVARLVGAAAPGKWALSGPDAGS